MKESGIYKIYFKSVPDKIYIGSAINLSLRKIRHKYQLKKQIHKNPYLQRLYNKYGLNDFIFEVIEIIEENQSLIEREQFYINQLCPQINILKIAGSSLGYRHTERSKKIISEKNKGRKMKPEQIMRGVIARIGQKTSKGCKRTIEMRNHLSLIKKRPVINTCSKKIYLCIGDAANDLGLKYSTLYAKLSGRNINNTNLAFL